MNRFPYGDAQRVEQDEQLEMVDQETRDRAPTRRGKIDIHFVSEARTGHKTELQVQAISNIRQPGHPRSICSRSITKQQGIARSDRARGRFVSPASTSSLSHISQVSGLSKERKWKLTAHGRRPVLCAARDQPFPLCSAPFLSFVFKPPK